MDPLTAAGAFATIVGLLGSFKSERSSSDLADFFDWLREKHQEEVVAAIEGNQALSNQLTQILSSNHDELINKLNHLDVLISSVAGRLDDFSGLASVIHAESVFSNQAISILKQFVKSDATIIMEYKIGDHVSQYILENGPDYRGEIKPDEPRFIEDDLQTLAKAGLLILQHTSNGTRQFVITRPAVAFIEEIEK